MWLYHNNTLQISGALEAEIRKILFFFEIEKPKYWKIDGEGKLAFRFGYGAAQDWLPASQLSGEDLIQKIVDYLTECANRSPMQKNDGFLLRWLPQGGYDRVNRICGKVEKEDYDWDGGFTVEPWNGWKGRIFRFSYPLSRAPIDEILVFTQRYLNFVFNGAIYPLPDGGFALGRYSREEVRKNPLLTENTAERETICRHMQQALPGQQEINGTFCDEEDYGFMLDYVRGQMEEQDKMLVLPYVCFCHK